MKIVWVIGAFILGWIVNAYLGYKLKDVAEGTYNLLSWYVWIFIALGLAIFFLLFLVDGARRYHERITNELTTDYRTHIEELETDYRSRLHVVRRLSESAGQATQLEMLYYNKEDEPENREVFRTWAAS